jgi:translation initiation factor 3 subunit L
MLSELCSFMQRGFRTGELYKLPGSDQFNKQYDRMLSLLAILTQVCPGDGVDDNVTKAMREKFGSRLESVSTYEEFFQSPKFVSTDPTQAMYRQQVQLFLKEMSPYGIKLRSYLKLYTSMPIQKLAKFHDMSVEEFLPILLSFRGRLRQLQHTDEGSLVSGNWSQALDIHFYIVKDVVHVDEAEQQRRFENYFVAQIEQCNDIRRSVLTINTAGSV